MHREKNKLRFVKHMSMVLVLISMLSFFPSESEIGC